MKKCKNFLQTLLKLAANQPESTVNNVRQLIQSLIDGAMKPEEFTQRLQNELKSSPQPYLVPFLNKSLPLLRTAMQSQNMVIEGIRPPKAPQPISTQRVVRPNVVGGSNEKITTLSSLMKPIPPPNETSNTGRTKSKYESSK